MSSLAVRITVVFCLFFSYSLFASRIKDLASIRGARNNQLIGYGLVVGLAGTGDKSLQLTEGSLQMVLKGLGVDIKTEKNESKNIASVVVTAVLPPFARTGMQLDATIASIGTASSLDGGTLLITPLKGPDGAIYAMAQGKTVVLKKEGGAGGRASAQNMVNALVPSGAILEKEVPFDFTGQKDLRLNLHQADFTTAVRLAKRIDEELGGKYAHPIDGGTVDVIFPYQYEHTPMELIARLEAVEVDADRQAKVVINTRTGTVVLGGDVRISPVAIAHNNLKIEVKPTRALASEGQGAEPAPDASADAGQAKTQKILVLEKGTTIADIVSSLNDMGASADDLVQLVQALKSAGSLSAQVEMQ